MSKNVLLFAGLPIVSMLALIVSFYMGTQVGAEYSANSMAPTKAFLAYSEISRIKALNMQSLLVSKEFEIDDNLFLWGEYQEHERWLGDILFPGHKYDREKFIRAVVRYRIDNPNANAVEIRKYQTPNSDVDRQVVIDRVLREYSDQMPEK